MTCALILALAMTGGCGLQDLDPIPDPPLDAAVELPEAGAPSASEACSVGPWLQRDEPCAAQVAGLTVPFSLLAPRTFCMGRPLSCGVLVVDQQENARDALSYDARAVRIDRGFRLMQTEVTRALWTAVMRETGAGPPDPPGDPVCDGPDCPVSGLSWSSAAEFANLASESAGLAPCYVLEGCNDAPLGPDFVCEDVEWIDPFAPDDGDPLDCPGYRLPTEAEWEYAARLDSDSVFFPLDLRCGSVAVGCVEQDRDRALLDRIAHHCAEGAGPRPVGIGLAQHPLGLHDLLGNVAEWVFDRRLPYAELPAFDPIGDYRFVDPLPDGAELDRIARGGSWRKAPEFVNAIRRTTIEADEISVGEVGFRLAIRFGEEQACEAIGADDGPIEMPGPR